MRFILLLGLLLIGLLCTAQPVSLRDSINLLLQQEPKVVVKLDTRNSFITGRNAGIRGVKVGLVHGGRFSFGLGYNWLRRNFNQEFSVTLHDEDITVDGNLHFSFFSPFAEYVFYDRKGFSVSIPVQIGLGASWISYKNNEGEKLRSDRNFVLLYEPAMTFEQRFLKYFAAGAGIGYRLMLVNNPDVNAQLTSPIYLIRFRILFSEVYNDFLNTE